MSELMTVPVSAVKPYPGNPRINDAAVDAIAESIRQCGYRAKIIVNEDMVVLAGHTRLKAIKRLGWPEVEVQVERGLTEEQARKYRLLDNKTAELAEWDFDKLREELEGLDFGDLDLEWGADWAEEPPAAQEDDFNEEPPAEPTAVRGQVWQLGRHRLMCGDSTRLEDVKKLVGGVKMDLLLTDPPYGVSYTGATKDKLTIENDALSDDEFLPFLHGAFAAADEVMRPGAAFYIWHADSKGAIFRQACHDTGWEVRQCLIWAKNTMVLGRQDYQWKHEPCLYGWKDGAAHFWASDRKQTTILEFDKPNANKEHPTMKPVALFDYCMCNNTKPGDTVLDLFAGSGTTLIAAEQNGRTAYCMEFDPKYADVIIKRWEHLTGEKAEQVEA